MLPTLMPYISFLIFFSFYMQNTQTLDRIEYTLPKLMEHNLISHYFCFLLHVTQALDKICVSKPYRTHLTFSLITRFVFLPHVTHTSTSNLLLCPSLSVTVKRLQVILQAVSSFTVLPTSTDGRISDRIPLLKLILRLY